MECRGVSYVPTERAGTCLGWRGAAMARGAVQKYSVRRWHSLRVKESGAVEAIGALSVVIPVRSYALCGLFIVVCL